MTVRNVVFVAFTAFSILFSSCQRSMPSSAPTGAVQATQPALQATTPLRLLDTPPVTLETAIATPPASQAPTSPAATSAPSDQALPNEKAALLFDYDPQAPLDVQEVSARTSNGITIHDITYASPKGGRVPAYLVVPGGSGPFAAIIVQHGMPGTRDDLLEFGVDLANTGAVVLAIDAPFARTRRAPLTFGEQDRAEQIQLIIDLRRGIDLLTARPDLESSRIAYIGFSYGGAMGGLLAGVEHRIKAYGLVVGDGGLVAHFTAGFERLAGLGAMPKAQQDAWLALMEPIEPIHFVGKAAPAALFFQNGRNDPLVAPEDAIAYQRAGSEPKRVEWYEAGHLLPRQAFLDQITWLANQIGIDATKFRGPPT